MMWAKMHGIGSKPFCFSHLFHEDPSLRELYQVCGPWPYWSNGQQEIKNKMKPTNRILPTRRMTNPGIIVMGEETGSVKCGMYSVERGVKNVQCGV